MATLSRDLYELFKRNCRYIFVRQQDSRTTKILRKQFNRSKSELFSFYSLPKNPRGYQWHHIVPLSLGGSNNVSNVVLCENGLHRAIHDFIEEQGKDSRARRIAIPCFKGFPWNMRTLAI